MSPIERGKVLHRIGDAIVERTEEFAELEVLDAGKLRGAARGIDVNFAARAFHYYAGWPTKIAGSTVPVSHPGIHVATEKDPVGVVGADHRLELPAAAVGWKLAPALAAGNTVILKPAEETPLSALWLAELRSRPAFPPGVLDVVPGLGGVAGLHWPTTTRWTRSRSPVRPRWVRRSVAGPPKARVTLELGGKSANIIFADADLDAAVEGSSAGLFWHSGQSCGAPSRLYRAPFGARPGRRKLHASLKGSRSDHGLDPTTELGPLVNAQQQDRFAGHVRLASREGRSSNGTTSPVRGRSTGYDRRRRPRRQGQSAREEIFGPVLTVLPFDDTDEVLRRNDTSDYGLAAGIWTQNVNNAHRTSRALRAGTVNVNGWGLTDTAMPFGGYRQSG